MFTKKIFKFFSTASSSPLVSYEKLNDIGLITIKNSHKRNALSNEILKQLYEDFNSIDENFNKIQSPRVVILASEGNVFSSGHDLKELNNLSEDKQQEVFEACGKVMLKIQNSNSIVIAEVQGLATAAGCQLAATCDLIIASNKAKFECPGIRLGLFCSTPGVALGRNISPKRAMHMLLTGEPIDAKTAQEWGLVNEVIDDNDNKEILRKNSLKLAEHINQFSGKTLSFGKKVFYSQIAENSIEEAYKFTSVCMANNLNFKETKEGVKSFLEKKKPVFNKIVDN